MHLQTLSAGEKLKPCWVSSCTAERWLSWGKRKHFGRGWRECLKLLRHSRCEPGTFLGVVEEETKIKDYIVIFFKMSLCTGSEEARCPPHLDSGDTSDYEPSPCVLGTELGCCVKPVSLVPHIVTLGRTTVSFSVCSLSLTFLSLSTHSARKFVYLFIFVSFETEIHMARASLELTI